MEKEKDELLNFAFNEQDDKLKFYRSTLVQMTKEVYQKAKLKDGVIIESIVKEADKLTKVIMKQVDEYENSFNYQTQINENPKVNYCFGEDDCVTKDFTCTDSNFFKGINPDFLKTEPIRTIVDNDPQYQHNQKHYGTSGEHWEELIFLFDFKKNHSFYKNALQNFIKKYKTKDFNPFKDKEISFSFITEHETKCLIDIANSLGIEFIEDFVKACEKCEE